MSSSGCWLVCSEPEGFAPIDVELVHLGATSAVVRLPEDAAVPAGLAGLVIAGPPWRALLVEAGAHQDGPERRLAVLASDEDGGRGRPGRHPRH